MKYFKEKDLEEIIYNADRNELQKRGLPISGKLIRQRNILNYGRADLLEVGRGFALDSLIFTIYELKQEKIGISAFLQAIKYAKGIQQMLDQKERNFIYEINIVLIGSELDTSGSFCYLPDLIDRAGGYTGGIGFIKYYTYSYQIDGIIFIEHNGYQLKGGD